MLMTAGKVKARAEAAAMAVVRAVVLTTMALRAMSVVTADCRGVTKGGGNCCCKGNDIGNNGSGGGGSGNNNGCGDIGSGYGNGDGRGEGTTMTVMLSAASSGGNCTTTDVCDAILPRYADAINVGSNDDGNRTPAIDTGNIDWWVADFDYGVRRMCGGVSGNRGER